MKLHSEVRKLHCKSFEARLPVRLGGGSARDRFPEMFQRLLGNMKRRLYRPTHPLFGQANLFYAECLSVGCSSVLLVGAPETDVSANGNQGRPSGFFAGFLQCECDRSDVVAPLYSLHVPAESVEPLQTVFGEREFRAAFDRYVVVCIKNDEFAQMLVPRIRTSLGRN